MGAVFCESDCVVVVAGIGNAMIQYLWSNEFKFNWGAEGVYVHLVGELGGFLPESASAVSAYKTLSYILTHTLECAISEYCYGTLKNYKFESRQTSVGLTLTFEKPEFKQ